MLPTPVSRLLRPLTSLRRSAGAAAALLAPAPAIDPAAANLVADVSLPHIAACLGGMALAAYGTLATTSLIGYSPTLLAERLDEAAADQRTTVTADLTRHDSEYLAVAMAYTALGWALGLWALPHAVAPDHHLAAYVVFLAGMWLFASSLPVAIPQHRAERVVLRVLPAVRLGWWVLRWPLVVPLLAATRACLWLLRIRPASATDPAELQKQVIAAVADSVTEDSLPDEERSWIGNIVALKDRQVSAVMRPRPEIVAFAADLPLAQAVQQAMEHGFSRYPVYEERIDEIVGIFYVKDALRLLHGDGGRHAADPVRTMVREPLFVPETMGLAQLLRRFQADHLHMAIVLDEYGTTAGLVSVEDVLEQIVGDLGDEYDTPADDTPAEDRFEVVEAGRVVDIPARTTVAEVNAALGTELPEVGDWETVAGLVIASCSRIPGVDEEVTIGDATFRVLAADERRIKRLRVTARSAEPAEDRQ